MAAARAAPVVVSARRSSRGDHAVAGDHRRGRDGCGRRRSPQFILDDAIQRGEGARTNLICTQPRRISATSVASRVAAERGESVGRSVGYKIRLESVSSSATRILFVTTGVLLRRLSEDPLLAGVSHVVGTRCTSGRWNRTFSSSCCATCYRTARRLGWC